MGEVTDIPDQQLLYALESTASGATLRRCAPRRPGRGNDQFPTAFCV